MSHLAVALRKYCEQPNVTASELEKRAGVPAATISHILRESHPRPERLAQLMRAVDPATACEWLVAYLRDDCPPEYVDRVTITVQQLEHDVLHESIPTPAQVDPVQLAWQRLQTAMRNDTALRQWFQRTVEVILGPTA